MANKYIETVLLPYFENFIDSKIDTCLYGLKGQLLFATHKTSEKLTLPREQLLGLSYHNATAEHVRQICNVDNEEDVADILKSTRQVAELHDLTIKTQRIINYIDLTPFKNYYHAYSVSLVPLLDDKGQVAAVQSVSSKFYFFGILDYLNALSDKYKATPLKFKTSEFGISEREHEVLFLLASGMSQNEISLFLNLRRGSISRLVSRLCAKFEIEGINVELLLKRAKKLRLHELIPRSLTKPRVVVLDPEIKSRITF